jgi:hypothetical protein
MPRPSHSSPFDHLNNIGWEFLSPRQGSLSGCGRRNGLRYGG